MKKLLLSLFIVFFIQCSLFAAPVYPGLIKAKQPDGTVIEYYLQGDEKISWAVSPDGYTLLANERGELVYATQDFKGDMIPSSIIYKGNSLSVTPNNIVTTIPKGLFYSESQENALMQAWEVSDSYQKMARASRPPLVTEGQLRVLCVLVDFPDKQFTHTREDFQKLLNTQNYTTSFTKGSVRDYFREVSYGKLDVIIDVYGVYRAPNSFKEYQTLKTKNINADPSDSTVLVLNEIGKWLAGTAMPQDASLDLSKYTDGKSPFGGSIKRLHIIFAGEGQENYGGLSSYDERNNCVTWSHCNFFGSSGAAGNELPVDPTNDYICQKDGKSYDFDYYSCSPELSPYSTNIAGIGVMCHELFHLLFNAPEYYGNSSGGTGKWDLMGSGSWNGLNGNVDASCPAHVNMYEKIKLGWVTPKTLDSPQKVAMENSAQNPIAYLLKKDSEEFKSLNELTNDAFFLLENKQKIGFDEGIPDTGLLIYCTYENKYIYKQKMGSSVNSIKRQLFYPVCASSRYSHGTNGNSESYGNINAIGCTFGNEFTSFTDETTPSSIFWDNKLSEWVSMDKPIVGIKNQNKIVTFNFGVLSDGEYHADDKEYLRRFIRRIYDENPSACPIDTTNWYQSETWIKLALDTYDIYRNISVEWNEEFPARIKNLGISDSFLKHNNGWFPRSESYSFQLDLDLDLLASLEIFEFGCCTPYAGTSMNISNMKSLKTITTRDFYSYSRLNEIRILNNPLLERITIPYVSSQEYFTGLIINDNPNLKCVKLYSTSIESLNIDRNPNIDTLILIAEKLSDLDLSSHNKLKTLGLTVPFSKIDLSKNKNLESLSIASMNLEELDLQHNTNLLSFGLGRSNLNQPLNLKNQRELRKINLDETFFPRGLDLTHNLEVDSIVLTRMSNIDKIDLSKNKKLHTFIALETSLRSLDLSGITNRMNYLYLTGNRYLTELKVNNSESQKFYNLVMSYNSLKLSSLDKKVFIDLGRYDSYNNTPLEWEDLVVDINDFVDFSSEYNVGGSITSFKWYIYSTDFWKAPQVYPIKEENGKFKFDSSLVGEKIECRMTNPDFPELTTYAFVTLTDKSTRSLSILDQGKSDLSNNISVYPTILNAGQNIKVTGIDGQCRVEIINMSGSIASSYNLNHTIGSDIIAPRQSGTYILRLIGDSKVSTHKIMVK